MSHFFAYLSRMKYIFRWGLMRNTQKENIQEHSLQVAMIAHALAVIRNRVFCGHADAERVMTLAAYHEISEVITGDLATPIKYFNPDIRMAYGEIEKIAGSKLFSMLPEELKPDFESLIFKREDDNEALILVKAADKLCSYLKCIEELKAGNNEFLKASKAIKAEIERFELPELKYFIDRFVPSFSLTLDELN